MGHENVWSSSASKFLSSRDFIFWHFFPFFTFHFSPPSCTCDAHFLTWNETQLEQHFSADMWKWNPFYKKQNFLTIKTYDGTNVGSVLLRCLQGRWLHSFWPASRSWGGHQRSELSKAAWCHWTHYSEVCKQPEPEDEPGSAVPAVSVAQSKVPRTPRTAGTTLQVKGAHWTLLWCCPVSNTFVLLTAARIRLPPPAVHWTTRADLGLKTDMTITLKFYINILFHN